MGIKTKSAGISQKLFAELQEAVDNAAKGICDPEVMKKACMEMDRLREELRKKVGTLDVAVDLIREVRDELSGTCLMQPLLSSGYCPKRTHPRPCGFATIIVSTN